MPTYQYSCTECGHFLEQFQNFTDDALTECPECGGKLRKVFNAVGVVFKGSGFYRNDSRNGGKEPATATKGSKDGQKEGQKDGNKDRHKDGPPSTAAANGSSSNGSEKATKAASSTGSASEKGSSGSAKSSSSAS